MVTPGQDDLGVVIPVVEQAAAELASSLPYITSGLRQAGLDDYSIVVVCQSKGGRPPGLERLLPAGPLRRITVLDSTRYSASHARNLGLDHFRGRPPRYLALLDGDCYPSPRFWTMVRRCAGRGLPLGRGAISWYEDAPPALAPHGCGPADSPLLPRQLPAALVLRHILMTYVFRFDLLRRCRFDESLGPGEDTRLKAGEDVEFIYDVLLQNNLTTIPHFPGALVYHPRRPRDLQQSRVYAEGQGALYGRLLRRPMPAGMKLATLGGCLLFLGHAVSHVIRGRPHAGEVLARRVRGLAGPAWPRRQGPGPG